MKKIISVFLVIIFSISLTTSCDRSRSHTSYSPVAYPAFDEYMTDIFKDEVCSNTLNMHFILSDPSSYDITDYDISLGDYSYDAISRQQVSLENLLSILKTYDYSTLSLDQQLTYDVLMDTITLQMSLSEYELYDEVLDPLSGAQSQLPVLMAEYKFRSAKDVDEYLQLLKMIPDLFSELMEFEHRKADADLFMADFAVEDVIEQCQDFCKLEANNYLIKTFNSRINEMTDIDSDEAYNYKLKNRDIVINDVIPAYRNLIKELTSMLGSGVNEGGLCNFKDGKDYYELVVQKATGSDKSISKLEKITEQQRAKDLQAMQKELRSNPELNKQSKNISIDVSDPEKVIRKLKHLCKDDFPSIPAVDYYVKYVDSSLEDYLSPAFYLTAPIDDINDNSIYINNASGYDGIKLFTTLAHEGYPGHMYQTIYSQDHGMPAIRSLLNYPGYTEGWATYVEMLSYSYAGLDDDLADLIQKNQAVILSLYATCDLKIHNDGWELSDMSSFLADYGVTDSDSITEMYHAIIENPANYLSYYIGYLEFLELRDKYEKKEGDAYSLRDFHEAVLKLGSAPFYILDDYLE